MYISYGVFPWDMMEPPPLNFKAVLIGTCFTELRKRLVDQAWKGTPSVPKAIINSASII